MNNLFSRFIQFNRLICKRIERHLPQAQMNPSVLYSKIVGERMRKLRRGAVVVDIGGGRRCAVAEFKTKGIRLVAIDVSEEELTMNTDVDEKIVADATKQMPFPDESVSMIVSKHALEHFDNIDKFVQESHRVLVPAGWFIHFFPCRYAPYAIINRFTPECLGWRLLSITYPETKEMPRFSGRYHRCYYSGFVTLLEQKGFKVEQVYVSYYQSHYFGFLVPLFLLCALYELLLFILRVVDLASYLVVVARKSQQDSQNYFKII